MPSAEESVSGPRTCSSPDELQLKQTKRNRMKRFILLPIAASLMLGAQGIGAEYDKDTKSLKTTGTFQPQREASDIIRKKVTNAQDEDLGKVQDLIINVENGTAPYAIIGMGGVLGANRT